MNSWVFKLLAVPGNFSDLKNWSFLIQLFFIFIALLLGNSLRRKVPFLKRSLIPSAILAGGLILLMKAFLKYVVKADQAIDNQMMETITYHCLGIGFIALALKKTKKDERASKTTILETGAITVSGYLIQAIVGLAATMAIFFLVKYGVEHWSWNDNSIMWYSGLLLPLGFGQGTGQAYSWGATYQGLAENNFNGGISFGLAVATIGFIVASLGGVVYLAVLRKQGKIAPYKGDIKDETTLETYETKNDIPAAESVDKMTIQFALVLTVYALTFLFLYLVQNFLIDNDILGKFGHNTLSPLLWGFNFLIGTLMAFLVKMVINKLQKHKIMNREYTNNYLLDRIGGFAFDIMIVAGTAAIDFDSIKNMLIPLIIICALGFVVTFAFAKIACNEIYKGYKHEAFLAMFGMLTGTASNGMILLRELDPKYETPMANNLVFQNLPAIVLGFPFLLLLSFAARSITNAWITLAIIIVYFVVLCIFLFRRRIFKKYKQNPESKA